MEKNKLYFIIIFLLFYLMACSGNNIEKGNFYSKVHTDVSFEASKSKAIDSIYYYIAKETSSIINRTDFNIVAVSLKDNNLIDFDNKDIANIREYKKDDNFYVEISVKDSSVYNKTLEILNKLKKEGSVEDKFFRANASIQMPETANLNAYTRQMLTQNALKRAYESLFNVLRSNEIDVNIAVKLTNDAYILEESYSSNEYNVVVETILE
ncbi:hypothetical protein [Brachyspira hampsonii]|uniref:Uncharacterized protein n=1 Tax=Brachyspira hampsonii TaxID=1287055 RepID=A0AAC9XJA5_9SPIR|nr:hypothetical protein [Brachyspira hampsonii]ASJ20325.1 hypothetical protein BHAMNSH16_01075 [Brachyspira hampsonii]ELV04805.1 hypothetical protein H263_13985 [Brachyspira hampsonii 30599]MBW5381633.1 hypothetical protein [Brachyspira hampsonii]MBW5409433.1 hypothetical protein [Brachyspira hampsonii]OEJ16350.1 hypothetical protein A9496_01360 [Brachyspira hampsonii]